MTFQPQLQQPGRGLPFWQWVAVRFWLFPKFIRGSTWESAQEVHHREGRKILALAESLSTEKLHTRFLVRGVKGIEDSSRFWSVAMAMEHLITVGDLIRTSIPSLSRGLEPSGKADVAAVKPKGIYSERAIIIAYQSFLMRYRTMFEREIVDRKSPLRFRHPWFGMLTAFQWHCLAASHTYIHRKQIEAVISGLNAKS